MVAVVAMPLCAIAEDGESWRTRKYGTGGWDGLRETWLDVGVVPGGFFVFDVLRNPTGGLDQDIFGVGRRKVTVPTTDGQETYKELAFSPLASVETVEQVEKYDHWPSADWFDYSGIEAQCDAVRDAGRVVVFM